MTVSEVELAQFLRQRTPRPLTAGIRRACLPRTPLTATIGLLIASMLLSVAMVARCFPEGLWDDLALDFGHTAIATGVALGSQPVSADSGLPADRSEAGVVQRIDFRFTASDGEPLLGSSFSREAPPLPNTPIDITYSVTDHTLARVTGTTRSRGSRLGLLNLLIPLPALACLLVVVIYRRRRRNLLSLGVNTRARVIDVVESSSTLGLPRLCVALSFRDGRSTVIMLKRGRPDTIAILDRANAGELVPVLRDLRNPARLLLLDRIRANPASRFEVDEGLDEFGRTLRPKVNRVLVGD
ncbi:MAG: hypothetical protein U1F36_01885 [Planctomycetota bacterium]